MKKLSSSEIDDLIIKHQSLSYIDISKQINKVGVSVGTNKKISQHAVRSRYRKLKLPKKSTGMFSKVKEPEEFKDVLYKYILTSKRGFSLEELSDKFDVGVSKIRSAINTLKEENKNFHLEDEYIQIADTIKKSDPSIIDNKHLYGKRIKFGFTTDNHLCSRYERLDVLNALYERFAKEGITTVYNAGNMIDGEARFNKFDIHTYGMEKQCMYLAKNFPKKDGITTYFITGDDHEGWYVQREGVNIGKFMEQKCKEAGRNDLVYLGHMEHDIIIKAKNGQAVIRIVHPGGGSSYAISYTSQKLVESYTPGEKPNILLMGHYHKMEYNYIRGVYVIQGGCTMDQSPFMRKKRLDAHVGGWICEYQIGENGVVQSFQAEWIPFYGKEFYDDNWRYQYE